MSRKLVRRSRGFPWGLTPVVSLEGVDADVGIAFSILRLRADRLHTLDGSLETAVLLLEGHAELSAGPERGRVSRSSLFDEEPAALHAPQGTSAAIQALSDCELAVFQTPNPRSFPTRIFGPGDMVQREERCQGMLENTAHRIVRTIFDLRNRPEARLVLGEVLTLPGRWSSYPPHHHPQPEIYHYRFSASQGYGHAELGERVYKVRGNDTLLIRDGQDHPQVAAPGYGMYYIWAIRHLEENPYGTPEFTEGHRWANHPGAQYWRPRGS